MGIVCKAVRLMPLVLCILTPIFIFITYGIAVGLDHVYPLFPYISDTGTKPPESCIFSLFLSGISFIFCIVVYVRYHQVSEYTKLFPSVNITPFWNRFSVAFGFLSCLGLDIVACFQESNQFVVHIFGALMCFFSATIYFFLQTIFTQFMHPKKRVLVWFRVLFTLCSIGFIMGTFLPVSAAAREFTGEDILFWAPNHGGYAHHLVSTFSEWFLVLSFCAYVCTFWWDFRWIEIEAPKVKFLNLKEENTGEEA